MSHEIQIRKALHEDLALLKPLLAAQSISLPESYYDEVVARVEDGRMAVLLALAADEQGEIAGYGFVNFAPKYSLYKKLGIPEIQNVNVLPAHRRQGIGERLIAAAEDLAREHGATQAGVSVGLHSDYGAAQRLYVRLGYVPDGFGVTYDRAAVRAGELRPVDDDLCLMLVKDLI